MTCSARGETERDISTTIHNRHITNEFPLYRETHRKVKEANVIRLLNVVLDKTDDSSFILGPTVTFWMCMEHLNHSCSLGLECGVCVCVCVERDTGEKNTVSI